MLFPGGGCAAFAPRPKTAPVSYATEKKIHESRASSSQKAISLLFCAWIWLYSGAISDAPAWGSFLNLLPFLNLSQRDNHFSENQDLTSDVTGRVMLHLADCCLNGTGTKQNAAKALRWYQKAEYACMGKEKAETRSNLEEIQPAVKGKQAARRKLLRTMSR